MKRRSIVLRYLIRTLILVFAVFLFQLRYKIYKSSKSSHEREITFIITLFAKNQIPKMREFLGSIHRSNIPDVSVMILGWNLEEREKSEISLWNHVTFHNVLDLISVRDLDLTSQENVRGLERYIIYKWLRTMKTTDTSIFIRLSQGILVKDSWKVPSAFQGGYFLVLDSGFEVEGFRGTRSKAFDVLNNTFGSSSCRTELCLELLGKRELEANSHSMNGLARIGMKVMPTSKSNWNQFCHIKLKDNIVNLTIANMKKGDITGTHARTINRTIISIGIPSVGRVDVESGIGSTSFTDTFLPFFIKSITQKEIEMFEFRIYVGFDMGDPVYDVSERFQQVQDNVKRILEHVDKGIIKVTYVRLPFSNAWLTFIWNTLYLVSLNDGTDYFFQANDDLQILGRGWATLFTSKLAELQNIGVVGPYDPSWKCRYLTQAMVSRKHYEIFGYFYPIQIKDWYSDFWLSEVYRSKGRASCISRIKARNLRANGSRYDECRVWKTKFEALALNDSLRIHQVITSFE